MAQYFAKNKCVNVHVLSIKTFQDFCYTHLLKQVKLIEMQKYSNTIPPIRYGLVARIAGFHPAGPGSIPGIGASSLECLFLFVFIFRFQLEPFLVLQRFFVIIIP